MSANKARSYKTQGTEARSNEKRRWQRCEVTRKYATTELSGYGRGFGAFWARLNGEEMESKRFTKNDNGFICENCGARVEPLGYSSRNHCPFCLCSKHVDVMPGDRANECGGIMDPIRVELDSKKGYVIIHKCRKCGEVKRNRAATEAKNQPDDIKKIIKLTAGEI